MQKQYLSIRWLALLLAICCAMGLSTALYAADEVGTPAEPGVLIVGVDPDGPAAAAGVARGDILLAIAGAPVNSIEELLAALATVEAKAKVTLQLQHGDEILEVEVVTGERGQRAYLGILPYSLLSAVAAPTMGAFQRAEQAATAPAMPYAVPGMPLTTSTQLIIVEVAAKSAAAEAGLAVNDVITALNGEAVSDPGALRTHLADLAPGDAITLTIIRGAEAPMDVAVTLGEGEKGQALLGVKIGVAVSVALEGQADVAIQAVPAQPSQVLPMPSWQSAPAQPEQHFYRFRRAVPAPFLFWAIPAPGMMPGAGDMKQWQPNQEFMQYQPGAIGVFSAQSGQFVAQSAFPGQQGSVTVFQAQPGQFMAQPALSAQQGSVMVFQAQPGQFMVQPAAPTAQESVTIIQGQPGQWMAQPAVPSASFEWQAGSNPTGVVEQETGAYY